MKGRSINGGGEGCGVRGECRVPKGNCMKVLNGLLGLLVLAFAGCGGGAAPSGGSVTPEVSRETVKPKSGGELVRLDGGEFTMGSAVRADEVQHAVVVSPFFIDKFPVTQEIYEAVMGRNPSKQKGKTLPVEKMTWFGAIRFCNKCSDLEGLAPCYDSKTGACDFEADGYRLPTEAEWEYACRAGKAGMYSFGDAVTQLGANAWFKENSNGAMHPVGQKAANAFGLFDMQGNVWQWCNDFYAEDYYKQSPKESPRGPANGEKRVLRGGAWNSPAEKCRAAFRFSEAAAFADACFGDDPYGFRRVRRVGGSLSRGAEGQGSGGAGEQKSTGAGGQRSGGEKAVPPPIAAGGKLTREGLKGTIIFASDRGGVLKIWSMQANGKDAKALTDGKDAEADPRFSPDGKRIMFTRLIGGVPEVWVMNRDGSQARSETKGSQAGWAPDGGKIVFIRENQAWVRDLNSKTELRITPEKWERCGVPAWSPDGRIAVASRHLEDIGIFLMSAEGKDVTQLKAGEACCTPAFARDGKKLLCQSVKGHVHQVELDGKNWEQVTFGNDTQHDGRYSPDGKKIVFSRQNGEDGPWQVCVQKLDGDEDEFVQLTTEGSNVQPDWAE